MKTLRQQHQDLDSQVNISYRELVNKLVTVSFLSTADEEDYDDELVDCENITFIAGNGENVDGYVLAIDKEEGIYIANYDDEAQRYWISLNDLASLYSKITIVELLENAEKENNTKK